MINRKSNNFAGASHLWVFKCSLQFAKPCYKETFGDMLLFKKSPMYIIKSPPPYGPSFSEAKSILKCMTDMWTYFITAAGSRGLFLWTYREIPVRNQTCQIAMGPRRAGLFTSIFAICWLEKALKIVSCARLLSKVNGKREIRANSTSVGFDFYSQHMKFNSQINQCNGYTRH